MTVHAYRWTDVAGDYVRAGGGLAAVLVVLALTETAWPVTLTLTTCGMLFAVFALGTAVAHATRFEVDDEGLRCRGVRSQAVAWTRLDGLRLAFYATRRDRTDGWMRLTLSARGRHIAVESRLNGFHALVARAARAAWANGVPIDPATAANLDALGIIRPQDGDPQYADDGWSEPGLPSPRTRPDAGHRPAGVTGP